MTKKKEKEIEDISADQMTMRDIFAAFAVVAHFSSGVDDNDHSAKWAYQMADAMLKERSK